MTSGGRRGAITDLLTTSRHPFRSFDIDLTLVLDG